MLSFKQLAQLELCLGGSTCDSMLGRQANHTNTRAKLGDATQGLGNYIQGGPVMMKGGLDASTGKAQGKSNSCEAMHYWWQEYME